MAVRRSSSLSAGAGCHALIYGRVQIYLHSLSLTPSSKTQHGQIHKNWSGSSFHKRRQQPPLANRRLSDTPRLQSFCVLSARHPTSTLQVGMRKHNMKNKKVHSWRSNRGPRPRRLKITSRWKLNVEFDRR